MSGRKVYKKIIAGVLLMASAGCSSQSYKNDCPVGAGAHCKSITEVNKLVNSGELESKIPNKKAEKPKVTLSINYNLKEKTKNKEDVVRVPEQTGRVWMAGFEDEGGDYVKETYVYTVLEGGKWKDVS